jgi:hypothetical protein
MRQGLPKTFNRVGGYLKQKIMLAFKELTITFDPTSGRPQRESATAVFNRDIRTAQAVLKGFRIGYTDNDHHVLVQEIDLDTEMVGNRAVKVFADFLLKDNTGNIDDRFNGWVQCIVIADLV